jgi:hypothetical protein
MKVSIYKLVGENCITYEAGQRVFDEIQGAFRRGDIIELDFTGTKVFVSQFFNAALGQLLEGHTRDDVESRVRLKGLPPDVQDLPRLSIENADRYYRDPVHRSALDEVLRTHANQD